MDEPSIVTKALTQIAAGDEQAWNRLYSLLESELRALARQALQRPGALGELTPTDLVDESFMKLVGHQSGAWEGRSHFLCVAAKAMRQVMVDHARSHATEKRGGRWDRVTLHSAISHRSSAPVDALMVDALLTQLESLDARQALVVEMRIFGGLTMAEIAEVLQVSAMTVKNDWTGARAWLRRAIAEASP